MSELKWDDRTLARLENVRKLAEIYPEQKDFAIEMGFKPQNLSRIIGPNPKRTIGNTTATHIENKYNLPKCWLDHCNTMHGESLKNFLEFRKRLKKNPTDVENNDKQEDIDFSVDYGSDLNVDYLPYFDLELSSQKLVIQGDDKMLISAQMMRELGLQAGYAGGVKIVGSYMEATLKDKTSVVVDLMKTTIESGKIYLLRLNNKFMLRRIYEEPTQYRIACDNPNKIEYADIPLPKSQADDVMKIFGKVVAAIVPL